MTKYQGQPQGLWMSPLRAILLLVLSSTCQAQLCETQNCGLVAQGRIGFTNITGFSVITLALSSDLKLSALRIRQSPLLVIRRADFDKPAFEKLHTLHLVENGITVFNPEPLRGLTHLQILNLQDNNITSIRANTFSGLGSVTHLTLSGNEISYIDSAAFTVFNNLSELFLTNINLHSISASTFSNGLSSLVRLELGDSRIQYIDPRAFNSLTSLKYLSLRENDFESLDSRLFETTPLLGLELLGNDMVHIENFPLNISSLLALGIQNCNIRNIPVGYFSNVPNLQLLALDANEITEVPANLFNPLKKLVHISLDLNNLISLSIASFDQFYKILDRPPATEGPLAGGKAKVDMANNPWNCATQDMVGLRNWAKGRRLEFNKIFDCKNT